MLKFWFILCVIMWEGDYANGGVLKMGYEYVPEADAWLRLHTEPLTWMDARLHCHLEGGALASPTTSAISTAMIAMMAASELTSTQAFIGVHAFISKGDFTSIEGVPIANLSIRWRRGEPNNVNNVEDCIALDVVGEAIDLSCSSTRPYFCRKDSVNMVVNKCGTTAQGYKLESRTGSCYKFHRVSRTWHRAAMACRAEGGHLAVINSNEEAQVLKEIFGKNPSTVIKSGNANEASVGVWDWKEHGEWLTIFGQTLSEAGFERWGNNEPNNVGGKEFCGTLHRDGSLNDFPCDVLAPFICEIMQ